MHDPYGLGHPNPGHGHAPGGYPPPPPPPGPTGYVSYGQGSAPPHIYTPTPDPATAHNAEWRKLEGDAQLWLIIAAVGFWFGFGWITGPLAWYFGAKIRGQYRALGHHPCSSANWAYGLGIASTVIYVLGTALLVLGIFVLAGALML